MKSLKKNKTNEKPKPQHQKILDCLIYQLFTQVAAVSSLASIIAPSLGPHSRRCLVPSV